MYTCAQNIRSPDLFDCFKLYVAHGMEKEHLLTDMVTSKTKEWLSMRACGLPVWDDCQLMRVKD